MARSPRPPPPPGADAAPLKLLERSENGGRRAGNRVGRGGPGASPLAIAARATGSPSPPRPFETGSASLRIPYRSRSFIRADRVFTNTKMTPSLCPRRSGTVTVTQTSFVMFGKCRLHADGSPRAPLPKLSHVRTRPICGFPLRPHLTFARRHFLGRFPIVTGVESLRSGRARDVLWPLRFVSSIFTALCRAESRAALRARTCPLVIAPDLRPGSARERPPPTFENDPSNVYRSTLTRARIRIGRWDFAGVTHPVRVRRAMHSGNYREICESARHRRSLIGFFFFYRTLFECLPGFYPDAMRADSRTVQSVGEKSST